jgi:signal transduction histidine kinase
MAGPRSLRQLLYAVQALSTDFELSRMLLRITQSAIDLVDARYGALGVLDDAGVQLAEFITVGFDDDVRHAIGDLPKGHGILGLLIHDAKPIRLPNLTEHPQSFGFPPGHPPMTSFLGVPIRVRDEVFGNLYLTDKRSAEVFTDIDEELIVGLAAAAGIAIENARLQNRFHELALAEDRERIARDLHDTVIQRLFATGMSLQSAAALVRTDPTTVAHRIERAVADLDVTIKEVRTAIFAIAHSTEQSSGLRAQVLSVVRDAAPALGFEPRLLFDGPIDSTIDATTAEAVTASLRELLSNVAKHADATTVDVTLSVSDKLVLEVIDNGRGIPDALPATGNGVANITARAQRLGGSAHHRRAASGGTIATWQVPLPSGDR